MAYDRQKQLNKRLLSAVKINDFSLVKKLIDKGANPNWHSKYDWTALSTAVIYNHVEMVDYLLKYGADPNVRDIHGNTPLIDAIYNANRVGPIIVKLLLENGADPNVEDYGTGLTPERHTPLELAIQFASRKGGNVGIVKLLLEHGADPNRKDDEYGNKTPLMYASSFPPTENSERIVKLLADYGAEVNVKDNRGETPLMYASYHGSIGIVKTLLSEGANANARDKKGRVAMDYALDRKDYFIGKDKSEKTAKEIADILKAYSQDFGPSI